MQSVLDALDDDAAIAAVVAAIGEDRERIAEALGAVSRLKRPLLPLLIDAVDMDSTAPARPVLDAYRALGTWLAERPRTTRLCPTPKSR